MHTVTRHFYLYNLTFLGLRFLSAMDFSNFVHFYLFQVPFLDATNTLLYPIIPLTAADYEEFGYPGDIDDFHAIRNYSPYDNIQKDVLYPAVLVTSSFNTR